ncbi:hypothetical protein E1193_17150 [Micromonospora sp. KC606]|uniref:hypothetical protein n=1 Tax=Micromonospora sp. KC606 TaxID=2530379 RepID=UPI00104570CD|nr:hypothetical protein [Micromonospora sp. KC606]TDC80634.1 hypothetical protein E1193_17150 [Micromonospora sp. KC606]
MNTSEPSDRERGGTEKLNFVGRRREKIRAEIERNRRGEYTVPTWVLVAALLAIVGAWLALILILG